MPFNQTGLNKDDGKINDQTTIWPCDERTAAGHHNILLAEDVLLLQRVDNVLLLEALEGERLRPFVDILDQFDSPETANAQGCHHIQIAESYVAEFYNCSMSFHINLLITQIPYA